MQSLVRTIINPEELNFETWNSFVLENGGFIFQSPHFWKIYRKQKHIKPVFAATLRNNQIQSLMLGYIQPEMKGKLGRIFSRALFHGGPVNRQDSLDEDIQQTINAVLLQVKKISVYSEVRNFMETESISSLISNNKFKFQDHLNILVHLSKGEEELFKNMHSTRRKQIRRGYKRGVTVELVEGYSESLLSELYSQLSGLYKDIGLPLAAFSYINEVAKDSMPKDLLKIFIAWFDNEIVGFRMVLTYNYVIFDWYAASDKNHRDKYINDILPWEVIKWGSNNNFQIFDFGGAGKPNVDYGVRDFKLKFGGELVNFGRYQYVSKPVIMKIGQLGLKILKSLR